MSSKLRTWMILSLASAELVCWQTAAAQQQPDFSKVQIKATKVSGNIYMLEGQGGNIAASVGEDGIVIVDDQFAPLADKIQATPTAIPSFSFQKIMSCTWATTSCATASRSLTWPAAVASKA